MSSMLKRIEHHKERLLKDISKLESELKALESKKEKLLQLKDICPTCNGSGEERYTDAAGSGDWRECETCRGLGKVEPLQCTCGNSLTVDMLRAYRKRECPWCGRYI